MLHADGLNYILYSSISMAHMCLFIIIELFSCLCYVHNGEVNIKTHNGNILFKICSSLEHIWAVKIFESILEFLIKTIEFSIFCVYDLFQR